MDQKTIAIVSYITIVGWIVALVTYNGSTDKSTLAKFHIKQALGLMLCGAALYFAMFILSLIIPFLFVVMPFIGIAILILWIIGLINAINGEEKPVPVLGEPIQRLITFIN